MKKITQILFLYFLLILLNSLLVSAINISECEDKEKEWEIKKCYSDIAIISNDSSLCPKSERYSEYCYFQIAIKLGEPSLCKDTDTFMFECYKRIAIKTGDISLCEKVGKRKCLIEVSKETKNYEFCKNDDDPDGCFNQLYKEIEDKEICKYITDKPEGCLCTEDEYLSEGECIKLECEEDEIARDHKCTKKCSDKQVYKKGECLYNCPFGFNAGSDGCGRNALIFTLYYFSIEFGVFFILFLLIISMSRLKFLKRIFKFFKKEAFLAGLKFTLVYLNCLIILIIFENNADRMIYSSLGVEGLSLPYSGDMFLFISLLPFIIGTISYSIIAFLRKKKIRFKIFLESIIIATGITIILEPIRRLALEMPYEGLLLYPFYRLNYQWLFKLGELAYYAIEIFRIVYVIIVFTLLLLLIKYVYSKFLRVFFQKIKKILPHFILDFLVSSLILLPIMIFVVTALPSTYDLANLLLEFGVKERLLDIRLFYSMIIYSFIMGVLFNLARLTIDYISRKPKK